MKRLNRLLNVIEWFGYIIGASFILAGIYNSDSESMDFIIGGFIFNIVVYILSAVINYIIKD